MVLIFPELLEGKCYIFYRMSKGKPCYDILAFKLCWRQKRTWSTNRPAAQAVSYFFFYFSVKLSFVAVTRSVDNQTPSALTFVFCQLKPFSGYSFSLSPVLEPIQRASVCA